MVTNKLEAVMSFNVFPVRLMCILIRSAEVKYGFLVVNMLKGSGFSIFLINDIVILHHSGF